MKKTFTLVLCCMLLLCTNVNADEDVLSQIHSANEMSLTKALELLDASDEENEEAQLLRSELLQLQQCEGLFIQKKDDESSGKTYTAEINFYLENGDVMCAVDYDNYGGELGVAVVEELSKEGSENTEDYLFVTRPEGTFFKKKHEFEILIAEEKLNISWGSNCEYQLYRSDGSAEELEDDTASFENSDTYQTLVKQLDQITGNFDHRYLFAEDDGTFYTYVALGKGNVSKLKNSDILESWNSILENLCTVTEKYQSIITLSLRDGPLDITEGHCTVMYVDTLKESNSYAPDEIAAIISDGEITYNVAADSSANGQNNKLTENTEPNSTNSNSGIDNDYNSRTNGEKNALAQAKMYLKYSPFSYSGLIDQLEYEGYSNSEATYAADHCGADWYEQAEKKAREYLNYSSFSYSGLVDQLEYEGFTYDQATYGADQVY